MNKAYFASCPRGLEQILAEEARNWHAQNVTVVPGGVTFHGDQSVVYALNLHSRIATRILWRLAQGHYRHEQDLYDMAYHLPWHDFFGVENDFLVKVTGVNCPLKSLNFVTLRIKDAVCDRFRQAHQRRPNVNTVSPAMRIHIYLHKNHYQCYLDTSGSPLYQRGLRHDSVIAPLRENLAAGILRLLNWQAEVPLIDAMCGSGTFLLEAVMMAFSIAPGLRRSFAFEKFSDFSANIWQHIKQQAHAMAKPLHACSIVGADIDAQAIRITQHNLRQAGFLQAVSLQQTDIRLLQPLNDHGLLLANPPYGVRIGEEAELALLYAAIGTQLKREFTGWRACFITSDLNLPRLMHLKPDRRIPLFNGGLDCRLFEFQMVAGSNRPHHHEKTTTPL